jgi:predicted molibdopterin-dependent oxidoreductase YjgC
MTIVINGREFAAAGSLLDAVLASGVDLPHLCKDGNLPAIGACRTCLVEADGRIVAACSVPAASVSRVETETPRVVQIRRGVLELTAGMIARHDAMPGGPCSRLAAEAFARDAADVLRYPLRRRDHVDTSNSFFSFHEEACILCGRCVVACQDLQHIGAIGLPGRGNKSRVTPGADVTFSESVCTSCGSCVAACPTTALRPNAGVPR